MHCVCKRTADVDIGADEGNLHGVGGAQGEGVLQSEGGDGGLAGRQEGQPRQRGPAQLHDVVQPPRHDGDTLVHLPSAEQRSDVVVVATTVSLATKDSHREHSGHFE